MKLAAIAILVLVGLVFVYAYVVYPMTLQLLVWWRRWRTAARDPRAAARSGAEAPVVDSRSDSDWPAVTVVILAHNEEEHIRKKLLNTLDLAYPADRKRVLVVSDGSSDRTEEIVREFAASGVSLCALPTQHGKTAAENSIVDEIATPVVVLTDASVIVVPEGLKHLVAHFSDPRIGVASGHTITLAESEGHGTGERDYMDYEMWVRRLESEACSLIGASGAFFAARRELFRRIPTHLSRDFSSPLMAWREGLRSIHASGATHYVVESRSLRREYDRKVRTLTRALQTLLHYRDLLNPFRHGLFAVQLWSHKILRWLAPLLLPPAVAALALLAPGSAWYQGGLALILVLAAAGFLAWRSAERVPLPRPLVLAGYILLSNCAAWAAWRRFLHRDTVPYWQPTRRSQQ